MLQTKFLVNGTIISVVQINNETALDYLPPKIYSVQYGEMTGFYLLILKDRLQTPNTIYGNVHNRINRCITTYIDRELSTGILLTGDKGTGKTLFASLLANTVIEQLKIPVLLIRDPFAGEKFKSFIRSIGECCLMFDEFGKTYMSNNHDDGIHQSKLLPMFDGLDKTKRLIILTENDELDINEMILNRPSRMYYHFKYKKMDEESIRGYSNDHVVSENVIRDIIELSRRSKIFSFDMLQSIIEEHKRFNIGVEDIIETLNINLQREQIIEIEILRIVQKRTNIQRELLQSPIVSKPERHDYTFLKIKKIKEFQVEEKSQMGSVQTCEQPLSVQGAKQSVIVNSDNDEYDEIYIRSNNLTYESAGNIVYETENHIIIAKEIPLQSFNYNTYFHAF